MKNRKQELAVLMLGCLWVVVSFPAGRLHAATSFEPNLKSLEQYQVPEWYEDAKFGVYMHWGPSSITDAGDWYARSMYQEGSGAYKYHLKHFGHPSKFGFKDLIPLWKAENFDASKLVGVLKDAGVKYVSVMAEHHDGFDLWDSKYNRWNAVNMGPKRNVFAEWREAILKAGLRFGFNEHLARSYSWFQPSHGSDKSGPLAGVPYDGADEKYQDLYHGPHTTPKEYRGEHYDPTVPEVWKQEWQDRVGDLIDKYHPDFWFTDGAVPFGPYGYAALAHFFNDNLKQHNGKLEAVFAFKNNGAGEFDDRIGVLNIEVGALKKPQEKPWQTGTHLGSVWYSPNARWHDATWIIHVLADNVSKNGNLQLNIPPRADGTYDDKVVAILREVGAWLRINGEAIYSTRPFAVFGEGPSSMSKTLSSLTDQDIRFTRNKANTIVYAIVMGWPGDGASVKIASLKKGSFISDILKVSLMGYAGGIKWTRDDEALNVTLPAGKPYGIAYPIKIEHAGIIAQQ